MSTVPKLAPKKTDHVHTEADTCPLCEQPIAAEQRTRVWEKIRLRQREEQATRDAELREKVTEAVKTATEAQARQHAQALANLQKQLLAKDEEAARREQKAREQALRDARRQMKAEVKKARDNKAAIEAQNRQLTQQIEQMKESRATEVEKAVARETAKIRELMARDKDDALNKAAAKHFDEKQKLTAKLQEVQRQLEKERAESLGEGQEVNLYNDLREAFPQDKIRRIDKGEPGADIRHEIIHKGEVCGTILYESKNRMRWSRQYATKLRKDQIADKADHAILATVKFPSGTRELTVVEGVIVLNPRWVVAMARLLRESTINMHRLRLSAEQRGKKREELYQFITSPGCGQSLVRQEELTAALLDLEKREHKQHEKIWKERGTMLKQLEKAQADFRGEIDFIIES